MIPPYFDRAQRDKQILNQAVKHLGKQLKAIPYKGITIKEAFSFIGYPNVSLDVKGVIMTKEDLYSVLLIPDGDKPILLAYIEQQLDKFFSQNVCIPKGINRHPYADVLHEWAEDISKHIEYNNNGAFMWLGYPIPIDGNKLRIKPQELVYEYLWLDLLTLGTYSLPTNKYMTNDEADNYFGCRVTNVIRVDETKRVRQ